MEKKIKVITEWAVDNLYNAIVEGKVTTFDGVIKALTAIAPLASKYSKETEKPSEIAVLPPNSEVI